MACFTRNHRCTVKRMDHVSLDINSKIAVPTSRHLTGFEDGSIVAERPSTV